LCGRIPLALRIVAARLRHDPSLSAASLVALLRAEGERLRHLRDDERGLTDILESSYAGLPEVSRRALRLLSLVPGQSSARRQPLPCSISVPTRQREH
jgi:hypothetical protein